MALSRARLAAVAWDAWRAQRGGRAAAEARQQARLADLVRFARASSPLYRDLYRNLPTDIVELRQLPVVTKPQLMANFDTWVTDPAVTRAGVGTFLADRSLVGQRYLGRYRVMTTSGVTGERGVFLHDAEAVAVYRTLTFLRGWLPRMSLDVLWPTLRQGNRLAALVTLGGHYGGATVFESARRDHPWPFNRIRTLSVLRPLPELVRELNGFQPAAVIGYPSALLLMAREQLAGRLRIRPGLVSSGGDHLPAGVRREVERAFACPVRENYGATEFPPIAWDCRQGELHVSPDWAILEPVDGAYRPVPPGQPSSSVLLTNLANRVQPILRYDLGDTITLGLEPCPCGNPFPTVRVEGHRYEILFMRRPTGQEVPLQPFGVIRVANETPGVQVSQVVQTGAAALGVRVEVMPGADEGQVWNALATRLRNHLSAHGLPQVTVERLPGPPVRDPGSGKLRKVLIELDVRER